MATVGSGKYTYEYVPNWAKMPANQLMGTASAVATDSQDRVYIFQRTNPPVLVFDREGNFCIHGATVCLMTLTEFSSKMTSAT